MRWWLLALLLIVIPALAEVSPEASAEASSENPSATLYDHARNGGSLLATAQICGFPKDEVELVRSGLEGEQRYKVEEQGEAFDAAGYAEAFAAGNRSMHELLALVIPQQSPEQFEENCSDVRKQFDTVRCLVSSSIGCR
jgi:hypothetical protein